MLCCSCLQVTFQAVDLKQALYLHYQLATIIPLMLALTAVSPISEGYLCDRTSRWDNIVAAGVDDSNVEESKNVNIYKIGVESIVAFTLQRDRFASIPRIIQQHPNVNLKIMMLKLIITQMHSTN